MRRIERKGDVYVAARRFHVRGETLVVFHVARALHVGRLDVTLEFLEKFFRRLAQDIDQHIDTPTVRHADDQFIHTGHSALLDKVRQHRYEAFSPFERKSFLADESRVQIAFNAFGRD